MQAVGKEIDLTARYCDKCVYKDINEQCEPCQSCITDFFNDWRNPKRKFKKFKRRE